MPAYDRFCDIHVTSGTKYDFSTEVLEYCKYQIETKTGHLVPRKALLVVDYISTDESSGWQTIAFALLKHFEHGRIVFPGGNNVAAAKIRDLWKERNPNLQEKIGVNAQSGMAGKVLTKFPEVGAVDADASDFKGFVIGSSTAGVTLARPGTGNDNPTIVFSSDRSLDVLDEKIGYLAMSVPMAEIANAIKHPSVKKMTDWIVKTTSKLRLTAQWRWRRES